MPRTALSAWQVTMARVNNKDAASRIPPEKFPAIHRAVMASCDALDGLEDGLVTDPKACTFDPAVLSCKAGDGTDCLTDPQIQTARELMSPARNSKGEEVFPGFVPGSELAWGGVAGGTQPFASPMDYFKYMVFENPNWDWRTFHIDRDVPFAVKKDAGVLDVSSDLRRFASRGGKVLLYTGWADATIAPESAIRFWDRAATSSREDRSTWMRLFMVPGMAHCTNSGYGPSDFDALVALEAWVEQKRAPERIVARQRKDGITTRTRPLCPHPQVARYTGSGSVDDASNFVCRTPTRGSGSARR